MANGVLWRAARPLAVIAVLSGCSASDPGSTTGPGPGPGPGSGGTSNGGSAPSGTAGTNPQGGGPVIVLPMGGSGGGGGTGGQSCATIPVTADVQTQPVDIIVTVDNSGSMQDEIDAVEKNINVNFANILQTSKVDYRVILVTRHERQGRATSICVTAPLSANATCPPTPDQPAFSDRFFQYSLKIESLNSLVLLVDTLDGTAEDEFDLAPGGWGTWLRPNASKVIVEMTDDNSAEMTSQEFLAAITTKNPQFGTPAMPAFVFHSIIGIAEKPQPADPWLPDEPMQTGICTGNDDTVENAGPVYQELSKATGGLRFPLCQFTAFDAVFNTIAKDVASKATIACKFPIPAPPTGETLDLSKVAVSYQAGDGSPAATYGQAMRLEECVPNAFYIDPVAKEISLCPETCAAAQQGTNPKIDVLFTCEPTFVDPPK